MRYQDIVRVKVLYERSASFATAYFSCGSRSTIWSQNHLNLVRVYRGKTQRNLRGDLVCRSIINNNDFNGSICLSQNTVHCLAQQHRPVMHRDNGTNEALNQHWVTACKTCTTSPERGDAKLGCEIC